MRASITYLCFNNSKSRANIWPFKYISDPLLQSGFGCCLFKSNGYVVVGLLFVAAHLYCVLAVMLVSYLIYIYIPRSATEWIVTCTLHSLVILIGFSFLNDRCSEANK